eukprot:Phypoly_transcript_17993.p1 GENE.Phypoly_transcript_17993~~Phypoly_transcript_17993.p1  ORF type:complete len:189 (+),score=27.65 Phypoly_transcript_17993:178-744(+)
MKNILVLVVVLALASVGFCAKHEIPVFLFVEGVGIPSPIVGHAIGNVFPLNTSTIFWPEIGVDYEEHNQTGLPIAHFLSDYDATIPKDTGNFTFSQNGDGTLNLLNVDLLSVFIIDPTEPVSYVSGSYNITGGSGVFAGASGFLGYVTRQLGPENTNSYTQRFTGIILVDEAQAFAAQATIASFSKQA